MIAAFTQFVWAKKSSPVQKVQTEMDVKISEFFFAAQENLDSANPEKNDVDKGEFFAQRFVDLVIESHQAFEHQEEIRTLFQVIYENYAQDVRFQFLTSKMLSFHFLYLDAEQITQAFYKFCTPYGKQMASVFLAKDILDKLPYYEDQFGPNRISWDMAKIQESFNFATGCQEWNKSSYEYFALALLQRFRGKLDSTGLEKARQSPRSLPTPQPSVSPLPASQVPPPPLLIHEPTPSEIHDSKVKHAKEIFKVACASYKKFVIQEDQKQSRGWSSLIPIHSHGLSGVAKVERLVELISNSNDLKEINALVKMFFNNTLKDSSGKVFQNHTGLRAHSFISFLLDELACNPEFLKVTTVEVCCSAVCGERASRSSFKNPEMDAWRTSAFHILEKEGLFQNSDRKKGW